MKQRHLTNLLIIIVIFLVSFPVQAISPDPSIGVRDSLVQNQDERWVPQMSPRVEICSNFAYDTDVAYNSVRDQYLVVCEKADRITGRRVSSRGEIIGDEFTIFYFSAGDAAKPKVAYDDINDRYLVIWFFKANVTDTHFHILGRFIDWNGPSSANATFQISEPYIPSVPDDHLGDLVFAHTAAKYLVVWASDWLTPTRGIYGREIPADGSAMPGGVIIAFDLFKYLENPSVAYNLARNEFFVVYDNGENIDGVRLDSSINVISTFTIAGWPDPEYEPAVAACHTADQYLVAWHSIQPTGEGIYARFVTGTGTVGTVLNLRQHSYQSPTLDIDMDCGKTDLLMEPPNYLVAWSGIYAWGQGETFARMIETNGNMSDLIIVDNGITKNNGVAGGKTNYLVATGWSTLTLNHLVSARIVGNTSPKAAFTVSPTQGGPNTNFKFDASSCSDNTDNTADLQVRWDWENNGIYDTNWTKDKIAYHKFNLLPGVKLGLFTVRLQVTDGHGAVDTTTRLVTVTPGSGMIYLPLILR